MSIIKFSVKRYEMNFILYFILLFCVWYTLGVHIAIISIIAIAVAVAVPRPRENVPLDPVVPVLHAFHFEFAVGSELLIGIGWVVLEMETFFALNI